MDEDESVITARFPFVMLLSAIFLRGSLFVTFIGPLIDDCLDGTKHASFLLLVKNGIIADWQSISALFGNFGSVSVFFFLSLISGLCLGPIERAVAIVPTIAWNSLSHQAKLFSGSEAMTKTYPGFLSWLIANPDKKVHWEWERFLDKLSWGLFLNITIFLAATGFLLWPIGWFELVSRILIAILYFAWAMAHSKLAKDVHSYYESEYLTQQKAEQR